MAHQIQLVNQGAQGYFQAQQSCLDIREAEISSALAVMRTPLLSVPQWDRVLQEAICNKQYKLRTAPQGKALGKKGTSEKTSGKVSTTSEQAKQSKMAAGRNRSGTLVASGQHDPAWAETTGSRAPSSQSGSPERGREWLVNPKDASTPLAARWMQRVRDSQVEESQTAESQTDDESRQGESRTSPNPQRAMADEITDTFDVEYRPNTAIQNPAGTKGQGQNSTTTARLCPRIWTRSA